MLRSRPNFQGTRMGFSTERSDALGRLMIAEDSDAVRMLLGMPVEPEWSEDIPRLVRGARLAGSHGEVARRAALSKSPHVQGGIGPRS